MNNAPFGKSGRFSRRQLGAPILGGTSGEPAPPYDRSSQRLATIVPHGTDVANGEVQGTTTARATVQQTMIADITESRLRAGITSVPVQREDRRAPVGVEALHTG
jgi:hypothetical protein